MTNHDKWAHLAPEERCEVCGQPDNTGDCDHTPLTSAQEEQLGASGTKESGMPRQGSISQIMASHLTNKALGHRIGVLKDNRRAFHKTEADALLEEAAKRLNWPDNYEKHLGGWSSC